MARILVDGFELNGWKAWSYSGTPVMQTASTYNMTGDYCIKLAASTAGVLIKQFDTTYNSAYFALKYRHNVGGSYTNICRLYNGATLMAQIVFGGSSPHQYLCLCDNAGIPTSGILASGTRTDLGVNVTYLIEFYYLASTTGTGRFVAKIDGITDINYTGITSASGSTFNKFVLQPGPYIGDGGWYDDIVVDDANWIGDTKVIALLPDGDGYASTWSASITGADYTCIDEVPISTADFLYTNSAGDSSFFTVEALPDDVHTISSLTVSSYSVEVGTATPQNIQLGIRTNSTTYLSGSKEVPSVNDAMLYNTWTVNPSTGTAFSLEDIDSIEIGIKAVA